MKPLFSLVLATLLLVGCAAPPPPPPAPPPAPVVATPERIPDDGEVATLLAREKKVEGLLADRRTALAKPGLSAADRQVEQEELGHLLLTREEIRRALDAAVRATRERDFADATPRAWLPKGTRVHVSAPQGKLPRAARLLEARALAAADAGDPVGALEAYTELLRAPGLSIPQRHLLAFSALQVFGRAYVARVRSDLKANKLPIPSIRRVYAEMLELNTLVSTLEREYLSISSELERDYVKTYGEVKEELGKLRRALEEYDHVSD